MAQQGSESEDLSASIISSSDMIYELYCEVCAEFNKNLEATGFCVECHDFLCDDCVKAHGINRASRNHVVQTKNQMPRQKTASSFSKQVAEECTEKCDLHPDRQVEYYCKDDGCLVCTICLVKHRQCKAVDHISDLAAHLLDSHDYQQFTTSLANLKTQSRDAIKKAKHNTTQAEKLCTDVNTTLQEIRSKMMKAFDELEQSMKKKVEQIKSADVKKMKEITDKGTEVLDEVEKISADLQTLESKKQLGQLFARMVKLEDMVQTLHISLDKVDENNSITTYEFEESKGVQKILDDQSFIGKLSILAARNSAPMPQKKPLQKKKLFNKLPVSTVGTSPASSAAVHLANTEVVRAGNDIRVKVNNDVNRKCWITGCALVPGYRMVVADCPMRKIKLINLETLKATSSLETTSKPWDVATITENQVAVTIRDEMKILFVEVLSDLKIEREMSADGECTAILYDNNNNRLVVGLDNQKKIQIMTMNGAVESTIDLDMIWSLSHIALSPGHDAIYVTDYMSHCVRRFGMSGALEKEYRDVGLKKPRGITVDKYGRVLVCGEDSNNIIILTPDLTKIKELVEGLKWPCTLELCHRSSKLYVGRCDDEMRVYQMEIKM